MTDKKNELRKMLLREKRSGDAYSTREGLRAMHADAERAVSLNASEAEVECAYRWAVRCGSITPEEQ